MPALDNCHGQVVNALIKDGWQVYLTKPKVSIMVTLVGDYVVIEADTTDHPLYQELMRRAIPREQIILRYAGEKMPETK